MCISLVCIKYTVERIKWNLFLQLSAMCIQILLLLSDRCQSQSEIIINTVSLNAEIIKDYNLWSLKSHNPKSKTTDVEVPNGQILKTNSHWETRRRLCQRDRMRNKVWGWGYCIHLYARWYHMMQNKIWSNTILDMSVRLSKDECGSD